MSFAKAAEELNVTPAALSFQIKSLEDHLGQPVFHRLNRAVELTEIGALLAPGMQSGFTEIASAWGRARRFADQSILTVTAGPAFTALWLAPRLFTFATSPAMTWTSPSALARGRMIVCSPRRSQMNGPPP